jgi:hypothetical protein
MAFGPTPFQRSPVPMQPRTGRSSALRNGAANDEGANQYGAEAVANPAREVCFRNPRRDWFAMSSDSTETKFLSGRMRQSRAVHAIINGQQSTESATGLPNRKGNSSHVEADFRLGAAQYSAPCKLQPEVCRELNCLKPKPQRTSAAFSRRREPEKETASATYAAEAVRYERSQINKNRRTDLSSPYEPREHFPEPPDQDGNRLSQQTLIQANEPKLKSACRSQDHSVARCDNRTGKSKARARQSHQPEQ